MGMAQFVMSSHKVRRPVVQRLLTNHSVVQFNAY